MSVPDQGLSGSIPLAWESREMLERREEILPEVESFLRGAAESEALIAEDVTLELLTLCKINHAFDSEVCMEIESMIPHDHNTLYRAHENAFPSSKSL